MDPKSALTQGRQAVLATLKTVVVVAVSLVVIGIPILMVLPGPDGTILEAPPTAEDWLLLVTLLSTILVAAFLAGVLAAWCDSLPRALLGGALVSQVVAFPLLAFVAGSDLASKVVAWMAVTIIAMLPIVKYFRSLDRSWRSHFS